MFALLKGNLCTVEHSGTCAQWNTIKWEPCRAVAVPLNLIPHSLRGNAFYLTIVFYCIAQKYVVEVKFLFC